jgi:hypothetical protein
LLCPSIPPQQLRENLDLLTAWHWQNMQKCLWLRISATSSYDANKNFGETLRKWYRGNVELVNQEDERMGISYLGFTCFFHC